MSPNDILEDVRRQPFEPFRLYVLDGTSYDIRHPDQCMVMLTAVIVAVESNPNSPYDRSVKIDARHVSRIEPLTPSPAPPGGVDLTD